MSNTVTRTASAALLVAALLVSQLVFVPFAFAAADYAATVESATLGTQKDGDPVGPGRDDPNEALGASDGTFVSLGYGGELVLGFPLSMQGNLMVTVTETTQQPHPLEEAQIAVSNSPTGPWTVVGTADNTQATTSLMVAQCFQYVRIIDQTDGTPHDADSDGFDLDAVEATYDQECETPEDPEEPLGDHGNVLIRSESHAYVFNHTNARAETGKNTAGGSRGGNAGNGGGIFSNGQAQDIEGVTTGAGGNGGLASDGGLITTGNATATARTSNLVNATNIAVNRCACEGEDDGATRVVSRTHTLLYNDTYSNARTGENTARGSRGGDAGNGGVIRATDGNEDEGEGQELDDVTTGNGGQGGAAGLGGTVTSGAAHSHANTDNIVNRVRVRADR